MKLVVDIPNSLYANLQTIQNGSVAAKRILQCVRDGEKQEPKTGHWEWVQYDYNPKLGNWHCSECRCVVVECVDKNEKGGIPLYKYCPQCGAKMVEPQESEGKTWQD